MRQPVDIKASSWDTKMDAKMDQVHLVNYDCCYKQFHHFELKLVGPLPILPKSYQLLRHP